MTKPVVSLIRCEDYTGPGLGNAIARHFELLGGIDKFVKRGDSVLLKPNFIMARSRRHAAQTDPAVIIETARLLIDHGARPFVADSPAWGSFGACIKALKLEKPLKELGVPIKPLDKPRTVRLTRTNAHVHVSSAALDADVIINLPKFKSHQQLVATFAVKNMFGCVTGKQKAYWHFAKGKSEDEFCELLIEVFKFLRPAVTIIDGVIAMDRQGPIRGRARPLGWLIAGTEPIACETVCANLVRFDIDDLPIVRTAKRMGFGCCDFEKIDIVGDAFPDKPCSDFEHSELIPIRFSLLRVCRSIAKQIILRCRRR